LLQLSTSSISVDILITEDLAAPAIEKLAAKYSVTREPDLWKTPGAFKEKIRDARALMVRNQTQVNAEVLAEAGQLIAIGRVGVGLDNIDLETATRRGIVVVAPLNANATSVAELTIGLMLALARKISFADRSTKSGGWDRKACTGIELEGKTLALCGLGRIGRQVALRARAFGLRICVYDPYLQGSSPALADLEATLCERLEDALREADFVSVHSPLTPATKHLFNAARFAAMKRGSFFINTSRGGIMDEAALLAALQNGHLAGAGLDVREAEPPGRGPFDSLDNVILTPHVGAFSKEAQTRTFEAVCDDLDRLLRGEAAVNFVNKPKPAK
jgi:D-3-phosphoglycerate dehydrogenase